MLDINYLYVMSYFCVSSKVLFLSRANFFRAVCSIWNLRVTFKTRLKYYRMAPEHGLHWLP